MAEVLKGKHSKADTFILPLTGLFNMKKFNIRSYLFWEDYSIEDYNLIVTCTYKDYQEFLKYCRDHLFAVMDRKGYLLESYDYEGMSVFVLDMSEWAMDIEMFMKGKYSKLSLEAKNAIESFHSYFVKQVSTLPVSIYAVLYPRGKTIDGKVELLELLDNMTPIEYVSKNYGFEMTELQKVGELGSIYDVKEETLTLPTEVLDKV